MKIICKLVAILLLPILLVAATEQPVKDGMMRDLDIIKQIFSIRYAPAEWKCTYADWDLDEQIEDAKAEIQLRETVTVKDYQNILLRFFNSTRDYHVGPEFYSTESAALPFRIESAEGRYFMTWVGEALESGRNRIQVGDELLTFNGRPIDVVIQELKQETLGNWESQTDQALAESFLTHRLGSCGHSVPSGLAIMTIRHMETGTITEHRLIWSYAREQIPELRMVKKCMAMEQHAFYDLEMITPLHAKISKSYKALNWKDSDLMGTKESDLPALGEIVEDLSNHSFQAYLFEQNNKLCGFIRIPHYSGGRFEVQNFGQIMEAMQEAETIVIDQRYNPGGSILYMYGLASMLTDQPLKVPKHRMTINQEDVLFAMTSLKDLENVNSDQQAIDKLGTALGGYRVDLDVAQCMIRYMQFMIDEWKAGRWFTNADYLYGIEYLKPNEEVHYSGNLIVLVNSLDFSCGDFLPAILQDNERALIIGSRTAGAGGYIQRHSFPNLYGLKEFTYTGSIAERTDLNPIENLGVNPDIIHATTCRDLQENHSDLVDVIRRNL